MRREGKAEERKTKERRKGDWGVGCRQGGRKQRKWKEKQVTEGIDEQRHGKERK